jgi:hypothetical protein
LANPIGPIGANWHRARLLSKPEFAPNLRRSMRQHIMPCAISSHGICFGLGILFPGIDLMAIADGVNRSATRCPKDDHIAWQQTAATRNRIVNVLFDSLRHPARPTCEGSPHIIFPQESPDRCSENMITSLNFSEAIR